MRKKVDPLLIEFEKVMKDPFGPHVAKFLDVYKC
jgi:hypothetical protein